MIQVPLTLRLSPYPLRPAAAFFVPGPDSATWLSLLGDSLSTADFDIYVLPSSRQDRTPTGILIIPSSLTAFRPTAPLIPFGKHLNLYLPTDAQLWPPLTDKELTALLHYEVNLFHPTIGLVGFAKEDRLRLPQLLAPPQRLAVNWSLARPGLPPAAKLISVLPLRLSTPQDILDSGHDDIAQNPANEVPKQPNEKSAADIAKSMAKSPIATASTLLQKLADSLKPKNPPPADPKKPDPKNPKNAPPPARTPSGFPSFPNLGLGQFLSSLFSKAAEALRNLTPKQFAALASAMQERRDREINRLLSLLQSNPDEGLKYALPLAGDSSRGLAPPSDRLGQRPLNFSLTGSSSPGDVWTLSYEHQQKLRDHYRRLASRELQLGRHRRAAYIFAQLLGDWTSAANALKQGRHFRESATLYKDRLNNKLAAADCLRDGGLLLEAIPLYKELSLFERAGDLYTQLEQPAEAEKCYREAVMYMIAGGDRLKAAAFLENRLHVPREALAVLDSAWPGKSDAEACLAEAFHLLARLRDFPEAQRRLRSFREQTHAPQQTVKLAKVISHVAATFPEARTQRLAADTTKVIVGNFLADASFEAAAQIVPVLNPLAPADRLLPRDAQRFVQSLRPLPKPPELKSLDPKRRAPLRRLEIIRTFKLPQGIDWKAFTSAGSVFFGVGVRDGIRIALRSDFFGELHTCKLGPYESALTETPIGMIFCARPPTLGVMHVGYGAIQNSAGFPATTLHPAVKIAMPWLPQTPLAIACDEQQNVWVLHNEATGNLEPVLSVFDPETQSLLATHAIDANFDSDTPLRFPIPFSVRTNHAYLALGNQLRILMYGKKWHTHPLGRPASHMVASHPLSRARVAIGLDIGAVVFSNGLDSAPIAEGLDFPLLGFTRGSTLVAAAKSEIRVYGFSDFHPEHRHSLPGLNLDATTPGAALLPTSNMDEIALISPTGQVQIINPHTK